MGCTELAHEDLLAFLADFARRRNRSDCEAWAAEAANRAEGSAALHRFDRGEDVDAWVDEGCPWNAAAKYLASAPSAVARLRGWTSTDESSPSWNSFRSSETPSDRRSDRGSRSAAFGSSVACQASDAGLLPIGSRTESWLGRWLGLGGNGRIEDC
eukprot:g1808.t1